MDSIIIDLGNDYGRCLEKFTEGQDFYNRILKEKALKAKELGVILQLDITNVDIIKPSFLKQSFAKLPRLLGQEFVDLNIKVTSDTYDYHSDDLYRISLVLDN